MQPCGRPKKEQKGPYVSSKILKKTDLLDVKL